MEDQRWLRFVTIGLVLAAVAVGYLLVSQRFAGTKVADSNSGVLSTSASSTPKPIIAITTPVPVASAPSVPASQSAYQAVANRTKDGTQTLPSTGFPIFLVGIISIGILSVGWGLKQYPH